MEQERSVIITLNPIQAQTLITNLQVRIDMLRSNADVAAQPGVKGRILKQVSELEAVHMLAVQAYNDWIGEESHGKPPAL